LNPSCGAKSSTKPACLSEPHPSVRGKKLIHILRRHVGPFFYYTRRAQKTRPRKRRCTRGKRCTMQISSGRLIVKRRRAAECRWMCERGARRDTADLVLRGSGGGFSHLFASAAPFVFLCTCEMILGGAESLHFLNQAQNVLIAARGNSAARRSANIQFSGSAGERFPSFFSAKP
jgi:hypothetical protein